MFLFTFKDDYFGKKPGDELDLIIDGDTFYFEVIRVRTDSLKDDCTFTYELEEI